MPTHDVSSAAVAVFRVGFAPALAVLAEENFAPSSDRLAVFSSLIVSPRGFCRYLFLW